MARTLFLFICALLLSQQAASESGVTKPLSEFKMTAQMAHELITEQQAGLLGDGSQLVSLYYFGQNQATSVVGLERVGDDYLPIRWLLVFESEKLVGWYYPVGEFPARFKNGHLTFPRGAADEDIYLFPHPPSIIVIEGTEIPFVTPTTAAAQTVDHSRETLFELPPINTTP